MIHEIETFVKAELSVKPTWSAKELIPKLESISHRINEKLEDGGKILSVKSSKMHKVSSVKKYDVLYLSAIGTPHYFLVHRVIDKVVYGVIFTTKTHEHFSLLTVKGDRIFEGNTVSNTYMSASLEMALQSYVRTYENKKEADEIFRKVKSHYKKLFA